MDSRILNSYQNTIHEQLLKIRSFANLIVKLY